MEVKEAVAVAKAHISDLFESENILNLGLEEVEFDDDSKMWDVTVGFSRPWDRRPESPLGQIAGHASTPRRSYKVVRIYDRTGKVKSVKNREMKSWQESA